MFCKYVLYCIFAWAGGQKANTCTFLPLTYFIIRALCTTEQKVDDFTKIDIFYDCKSC